MSKENPKGIETLIYTIEAIVECNASNPDTITELLNNISEHGSYKIISVKEDFIPNWRK